MVVQRLNVTILLCSFVNVVENWRCTFVDEERDRATGGTGSNRGVGLLAVKRESDSKIEIELYEYIGWVVR